MSKSRKSNKGTVKVHVTLLGGMYVDANELLHSEAAQRTMAKMQEAMAGVSRESQRDVRPTKRADEETLLPQQ